jgi:hypothetical protein
MIRRVFATAALISTGLVSGCAKTPPPVIEVEGRVTVNGQPLPKAEVRFFPMIDFGAEFIAVGETDDDGRYKLSCRGQPGACAGENRVTITEAPLPAELRGYSAEAQTRQAKYRGGMKNRPIPPQYANLAQSPLKIAVTADRKTYDLDLTR